MKQINWINSWNSNAKKNKVSICLRLWKLTVLDVAYVIRPQGEYNNLRLIIFNLGFEI
jgi:hypothetical protein